MNIIELVIEDAIKDKQIIGAQIRLKKNGRFSNFNGQVKQVKVCKNGSKYVLVENFRGKIRQDGRKWQSVKMDNIIKIYKDGMIYGS